MLFRMNEKLELCFSCIGCKTIDDNDTLLQFDRIMQWEFRCSMAYNARRCLR